MGDCIGGMKAELRKHREMNSSAKGLPDVAIARFNLSGRK